VSSGVKDMRRREFISSLPSLMLSYSSSAPSPQAAGRGFRVLINPGHNKRNVGCQVKGINPEYILTTRIAEKTKSFLEKSGLEAVLTRDENKYLDEINDYAEKNNIGLRVQVKGYRAKLGLPADEVSVRESVLLLSIIKWADLNDFDAVLDIHVNAVAPEKRKYNHGFSVFASTSNNAFKGSKSLALSIHKALSRDFSPSNNGYEADWLRINNVLQRIPGISFKNFVMLGNGIYKPRTPAVLIECGYISEAYGKEKLTIGNEEIQEKYSSAISKGVNDYHDLDWALRSLVLAKNFF
jgi:N-acetylmuramoyl-L-alanine amidase